MAMTPDEFRAAVAAIPVGIEGDHEVIHARLDELCWQVLGDLGYSDGLDLTRDWTLWYA